MSKVALKGKDSHKILPLKTVKTVAPKSKKLNKITLANIKKVIPKTNGPNKITLAKKKLVIPKKTNKAQLIVPPLNFKSNPRIKK